MGPVRARRTGSPAVSRRMRPPVAPSWPHGCACAVGCSGGAPGTRPTRSTSVGLGMGVSSPVSPKQRLGTASPQTEPPKCTELVGPVGLAPRSVARATGDPTDLDADFSYVSHRCTFNTRRHSEAGHQVSHHTTDASPFVGPVTGQCGPSERCRRHCRGRWSISWTPLGAAPRQAAQRARRPFAASTSRTGGGVPDPSPGAGSRLQAVRILPHQRPSAGVAASVPARSRSRSRAAAPSISKRGR